MKHLGLFLTLLSVFLIGGCQSEDVFSLPVKPKPYLIGLPADLSNQQVSSILNCAKTMPDGSIQTTIYTKTYPDPTDFNLLIWQGNPAFYPALNTDAINSFVIGIEEIVVIVSPENYLTSLSLTDLQSIFAGKIQDWSEIPQSGLSEPIELWVFYDTHPLRLIFDDVLFRNLTISTSALIMPSQAEANSLIEENANILSYIGKSQVSPNSRILPVSGVPETPSISLLVIIQDIEESRISPVLDCLLNNNSH